MSTQEYATIHEEIASVGDKKVKIVGSIATVVCNLLNDVFFNKEVAQEKRTVTTFEEYQEVDSSNNVIQDMVSNIQKHKGNNLIITTPVNEITDELKDQLSSVLHKYQKGFHLITYPENMDRYSLKEINDMNQRLVSLENHILDNGGHVYRTLFIKN